MLDLNAILQAGKTGKKKTPSHKSPAVMKESKKKLSKKKHKQYTAKDVSLDLKQPKLKKGYHEKQSFNDLASKDFELFTGKIWMGEHWNPETESWETREGYWFDHIAEKVIEIDKHGDNHIKYVGKWVKGSFPVIDRFFYWYYEFIFDPKKYANPVYPGQAHKEWGRKIEQGKKIQFMCPRDHFKSTFLVCGYATYTICEKPDLSKMGILLIAWDKDLAGDLFNEIKENLDDNKKILSFYGRIIDNSRPNNSYKFYFKYSPNTARYGVRRTTFKSGSITGGHPYLVFADDIEDEPLSKEFMTKFKTIFLKKLIPAMGIHGRIIITGTIKGYNTKNDCYLLIETNPLWITHTYPAADAMPKMEDVKWEIRKRPSIDPQSGEFLINAGTGEQILETYIHVEVKDREKYIPLFPERYQIEDLVAKRIEIMSFSEIKDDDVFWSEYMLIAKNPKGRRFDVNRIAPLPPSEFISWESFKNYLKNQHIPIYIWIDPGGKGKHGQAMALIAFDIRDGICRYYILDVFVCKGGVIQTAREVGNWLLSWKVAMWGVEGNYNQKETAGDMIDKFLHDYLKGKSRLDVYSLNQGSNNTGDKLLRIDTHFNAMLGAPDMPIQLFINSNARDYERLMDEIKDFPNAPKSGDHEFDLMDAITSAKINLLPKGGGFFWFKGDAEAKVY